MLASALVLPVAPQPGQVARADASVRIVRTERIDFSGAPLRRLPSDARQSGQADTSRLIRRVDFE
jgi:hypothetical protein